MKKTIAEIVSYQVELRLPQTGMKPLPVFQRTDQLLQDIKLLENVTQEQNELLKVSGFRDDSQLIGWKYSAKAGVVLMVGRVKFPWQ